MTENEVKALFGYNLKRIRKLKNISQMQLAEAVDMVFTFISDVENGKKWVSPDSIAKLSKALDVEMYQFFLPKDYVVGNSPDINAFAEELENSFHIIKSRYVISG